TRTSIVVDTAAGLERATTCRIARHGTAGDGRRGARAVEDAATQRFSVRRRRRVARDSRAREGQRAGGLDATAVRVGPAEALRLVVRNRAGDDGEVSGVG